MTREPEWDDATRARATALAEYEALLCPCGCGVPMTEAHDSASAFKVDKFICYAERARVQIRDREREAAEKVNRPEGWDTGLHYYVMKHEGEEVDG